MAPKIEYYIPDEDSPGYLLRWEKRIRFLESVNDDAHVGRVYDDLVDWLASYVTKPADPEKAREALKAASKRFIKKMTEEVVVEFEADPN